MPKCPFDPRCGENCARLNHPKHRTRCDDAPADSFDFWATSEHPAQHVHDWQPTDSWLIDRCSTCGEERA